MPIPHRMLAVLAALLSLHSVAPASAQTRDAAGGRDYSGISRFAGGVIAPTRLRTAGIGLLAPVGSNATDAGCALNRRVELVAP
ncbi:hypothetical protein [Bradyrhizobium sp. 186]|uniref:hypothetical protein n=1 Tax=Bradyrhizobium sp. 186 TaxID=2782654 RepID=UPI002000AB55|nr:hypothetical protein [Bradyrhizobium sp. 186]